MLPGRRTIPVTRRIQVHPPGAKELSDEFRRAAGFWRQKADELKGYRWRLDNVWLGRSWDRFMNDLGFAQQWLALEDLAEWLELQARLIAEKTVEVEEVVYLPITPEPQ